jgi:hypothetical protein
MRDIVVAVVVGVVGIKVWYDIVQFVYYRERMRACTEVVKEGVVLLRLAIERGVLSSDWSTLESNAQVISKAMGSRLS